MKSEKESSREISEEDETTETFPSVALRSSIKNSFLVQFFIVIQNLKFSAILSEFYCNNISEQRRSLFIDEKLEVLNFLLRKVIARQFYFTFFIPSQDIWICACIKSNKFKVQIGRL